jgi:hypothetical protein
MPHAFREHAYASVNMAGTRQFSFDTPLFQCRLQNVADVVKTSECHDDGDLLNVKGASTIWTIQNS